MNFSGKNKLSGIFREMKEQMDADRPAKTPGILTRRTTRGHFRKPNPYARNTQGNSDKPVYL